MLHFLTIDVTYNPLDHFKQVQQNYIRRIVNIINHIFLEVLQWIIFCDICNENDYGIICNLEARLFNCQIIQFKFSPAWSCLADAIHNFMWVKTIQIWQNEGQ